MVQKGRYLYGALSSSSSSSSSSSPVPFSATLRSIFDFFPLYSEQVSNSVTACTLVSSHITPHDTLPLRSIQNFWGTHPGKVSLFSGVYSSSEPALILHYSNNWGRLSLVQTWDSAMARPNFQNHFSAFYNVRTRIDAKHPCCQPRRATVVDTTNSLANPTIDRVARPLTRSNPWSHLTLVCLLIFWSPWGGYWRDLVDATILQDCSILPPLVPTVILKLCMARTTNLPLKIIANNRRSRKK